MILTVLEFARQRLTRASKGVGAGAPSMSAFHDTNLLRGHFRSKVRVDVLYDVAGIEKQYDETRTVQ